MWARTGGVRVHMLNPASLDREAWVYEARWTAAEPMTCTPIQLRLHEFATHRPCNGHQSSAEQSQCAGFRNRQLRLSEMDTSFVIRWPLVCVCVDRLRRGAAHFASGPKHPADLAGKIKHVARPRMADHRPGNRPEESPVKDDSLRLAEIAYAFDDERGAYTRKGSSGPETGAGESAGGKTDRPERVSTRRLNPVEAHKFGSSGYNSSVGESDRATLVR